MSIDTYESIKEGLGAVEGNDQSRAGQFASKQSLFGPNDRYSVAAVHVRFPCSLPEFFVWDNEAEDRSAIRQASTLRQALSGLIVTVAEIRLANLIERVGAIAAELEAFGGPSNAAAMTGANKIRQAIEEAR